MKTILIVDDTPELLKSIAFSLRMENYDVLPFGSAEDALVVLGNTVPHLIITDLTMPGMDGFEFIAQVKKKQTLHAVPIIIFSARPVSENRPVAMELGVRHYISKPATIEGLLDEIGKILEDTYGK